ncbi:hypothetical protein [Roseobacter cerasinus]|uniref:hypothetical protein n=1 Tax=Roseobacter cerasinus TaxID=2602289 RepID=UPI00135A279A|nr:hypothetical protein [Roseobacter cerasinus]
MVIALSAAALSRTCGTRIFDIRPVRLAQRHTARVDHQLLVAKEATLSPVNLAGAFERIAQHHVKVCQYDDRTQDQPEMFRPGLRHPQ